MEATDQAFQKKNKLKECEALQTSIEFFVNASGLRLRRNIPKAPIEAKSDRHLKELLEKGHRYIHVSCHGNHRELSLRRGKKFQYDRFVEVEFPSATKLLFLNACLVAGGPTSITAFASLCKGRKGEKFVIAPKNEVSFETALTFSMLFYDFLLGRHFKIVEAFHSAGSLRGFDDLAYVCLDANSMKTHTIVRGDGRCQETNLRFS